MNAKISVFVICVEAIIYLLLYNLHDCTFKGILKNLLLTKLKSHCVDTNVNRGSCVDVFTIRILTCFISSNWRCSVKKEFLKISQNSQENNCARASFLIKRLWHWSFPVNFAKFLITPFHRTRPGDYFFMFY